LSLTHTTIRPLLARRATLRLLHLRCLLGQFLLLVQPDVGLPVSVVFGAPIF
jgi:hypothetical protein